MTYEELYDMLQELYRDTNVNAAILKLINSPKYKKLSDPISIGSRTDDKGEKFRQIMIIVKHHKKIAEAKLLQKLATLQHKDDKKLSALVSYKRSLHNKKLIQAGIRDKNALYPLYQFSK